MIYALNIGGGRKFAVNGWINLDSVTNDPGVTQFVFSPDCTFPIADEQLDIVYSSHALEHLDDETVSRVLVESHRTLKRGGSLVMKVPDFDEVLAAYRRNDVELFHRWPGIHVMKETCSNRNVPFSVATIAAQVFCGFWNKQFGDMFNAHDTRRAGAYYGPPVMPDKDLRSIFALSSPHDIAAALRAHVMANEKDYTFNHQNAWGYGEFAKLMADHGFAVMSLDKDVVIDKFKEISSIESMKNISMYCDGGKPT